MRMYNSLGPNPRCVRMFMAEKGITLDTTRSRYSRCGKPAGAVYR